MVFFLYRCNTVSRARYSSVSGAGPGSEGMLLLLLLFPLPLPLPLHLLQSPIGDACNMHSATSYSSLITAQLLVMQFHPLVLMAALLSRRLSHLHKAYIPAYVCVNIVFLPLSHYHCTFDGSHISLFPRHK